MSTVLHQGTFTNVLLLNPNPSKPESQPLGLDLNPLGTVTGAGLWHLSFPSARFSSKPWFTEALGNALKNEVYFSLYIVRMCLNPDSSGKINLSCLANLG